MNLHKKKYSIVYNDRLTWLAYGIIFGFTVLSLIAPLVANEDPLQVKIDNETYWPIFKKSNWQKKCRNNSCRKIYTLIPFSPETIDVSTTNAPPGIRSRQFNNKRHWLGTDGIGRDVLSAVVHGSRTAIWISIPAVFLAFLFGAFYGMCVGYYGDDRLVVTRRHIMWYLIALLTFIYISAFIRNLFEGGLITRGLALLLYAVGFVLLLSLVKFMSKWLKAGKTVTLHVDAVGMRVIDMIKALPGLFIVLFALQLFRQQHTYHLIVLIAFLLWAVFARHARAEVLRLRQHPSVQSALLTGRSDWWVWTNEILPFIIRPLLVTMAFSLAGAILLEATLSFLGIGLPVDHVSWGTLINDARMSPTSWWLLVFPGLCMLSLIWSFQHVGRIWESRLLGEGNFEIEK